MRVIVIGAGVIGITTAWYLARDGHEVEVIEAREGVALETSFANAGGICPSFAGPWAAPGMPLRALGWMFRPSAPLKIRPRLSSAQWGWLLRFARNCTPERYAQNKIQMQKIAHYSLKQLRILRDETGIRYDNAAGGVLQIFQTEAEMAAGRRNASVLTQLGIAHRLLSGAEAAGGIEPGLARSDIPLVGALMLTEDETGDCHLFCRELEQLCRAQGVRFRFSCRVTGLRRQDRRVAALETTQGTHEADTVVLATGPQVDLFRGLRLSVPLYPIKGYSMTVPVRDNAAAPVSSVMDEHSKIMITRLGNRIRAAGIAELSGYDGSMPKAVMKSMRGRVEALFPGAAEYDAVQWWHGFRPMTPAGCPVVGQSHIDNLFLNIGHGSNGWTQACGTGRMVADLVAGRPLDPALGG